MSTLAGGQTEKQVRITKKEKQEFKRSYGNLGLNRQAVYVQGLGHTPTCSGPQRCPAQSSARGGQGAHVPWGPMRQRLTHQLQQLVQGFTEDSKRFFAGKGLGDGERMVSGILPFPSPLPPFCPSDSAGNLTSL